MNSKFDINITNNIKDHASYAYSAYYSKPYENGNNGYGYDFNADDKLPRVHHGIQHASRVALYITALINLYRKYGDKEALSLTQEDLKLLQIAAIFHDCARQNDGEDLWDCRSALNLYNYLVNELHITKEKAKLFAEAIANKDYAPKKAVFYNELNLESVFPPFNTKDNKRQTKNIFEKILHDADCLDIIRARDHFDPTYLDFYKNFVINNQQALEDLAHLKCEVTSLIELQGDGRGRTNKEIKRKYENKDAYSKVVNSLSNERHSFLKALYANNNLLSPEELQKINVPAPNSEIAKKLKNGKLFFRGILCPSMYAIKRKDELETLGALEIRKTMRRKGIPTRSIKKNNQDKQGNLVRSISMLGWGTIPYCASGFIVEPKSIRQISEGDIDSMRGKKNHLKEKSILSETEKEKQLKNLLRILKRGKTNNGSDKTIQNEIIADIEDFKGICFTNDPTIGNGLSISPICQYAQNRFMPILEAIYLQKLYKNKTNKELPIYEYSGIHNFIDERKITDKDIIDIWEKVCQEYLKKHIEETIKQYGVSAIKDKSLDKIKKEIFYIYGNNLLFTEGLPLDAPYEDELKKQVNQAIEITCDKIIHQYLNKFNNDFARLNLISLIENEPGDKPFLFELSYANNEHLKKLEQVFSSKCSVNEKEVDDYWESLYDISFYEKGSIAYLNKLFYDHKITRQYMLSKLFNKEAVSQKYNSLISQKIKKSLAGLESLAKQNNDCLSIDFQALLSRILRVEIIFNLHNENINNYVEKKLSEIIGIIANQSTGREHQNGKFVRIAIILRDFGMLKGPILSLLKEMNDKFPFLSKCYKSRTHIPFFKDYLTETLSKPNVEQNILTYSETLHHRITEKAKEYKNDNGQIIKEKINVTSSDSNKTYVFFEKEKASATPSHSMKAVNNNSRRGELIDHSNNETAPNFIN